MGSLANAYGERPSVRATLSTSEPLSTSPQVDSPSLAPVEINLFECWLIKSELTLQQVADRFGVSRQAVHKWKAKGAPPEVKGTVKGVDKRKRKGKRK